MLKTTLMPLCLLTIGLVAPAAAQDCAPYAGKFRGNEGVVTEITLNTDGSLSVKTGDTAPITATCLPPLVSDGKEYPQAKGPFDISMGAQYGEPDCCTMTLNGNQIYFDKTSFYLQRFQ